MIPRTMLFAVLVGSVATGCDVERTTEVSGTVVEAGGSPVPGAEVTIYNSFHDRGESPSDLAITGADGEFRVSFSLECNPLSVTCEAIGGELVVDADGYESIVLDVPSGRSTTGNLTLRPYDGLSVEETGIPDEQPRPVVELTAVLDYVPTLAEPGTYRAPDIETVVGASCGERITAHGRVDQLLCTGASGVPFFACFESADEGARGTVLCRPESVRPWMPIQVLTPMALPSPSDPDRPGLPLEAFIASDFRSRLPRPFCRPPTEPLTTNTGETIAYECSGVVTTWLLDDVMRGDVWTATRVGSAAAPTNGVVEVLGRRTVVLEEVWL